MDDKTKVLESLKKSDKPLKAGEIAVLTGMDRKLVDKAMKKLKEDGVIVSPKSCFWEAK